MNSTANGNGIAAAAHLPLKNKTAIVTGGSRGIGAGIALELASRGANVAIVYSSTSSTPKAEAVVSKIVSLGTGARAHAIRTDLRAPSAPVEIVSATLEAFPGQGISVLVNNAGCENNKFLKDLTLEDFNHVFDLNIRAPWLLSKEVLPHLQRPGRIINIGSIGGRKGFAGYTLYGSTKAALEGFTRNLAAELGGEGHTVNCVCPGPTESDMVETLPEEVINLQKMLTPVENRLGRPQDIAEFVCWLAEEGSRWITGQTICVSGGLEKY